MLRVSRLSAIDTGDNEMIPGAVHRSPGIYLTAEDAIKPVEFFCNIFVWIECSYFVISRVSFSCVRLVVFV